MTRLIGAIVVETCGWCALGYGLWLAWPPLCPVVIGGIVVYQFMSARKRE